MYKIIKKFKSKIKNCSSSEYFPFIIFIAIIAVFNIFIVINGDDIFFKNLPLKDTFNRYYTWSSRNIIEISMTFLLKNNIIFWKIADIFIFFVLIYSINKLFISKNKKILNYFLCMLVLFIPFKLYSDAGYVATLMNYIWPLALGLYSLIPIKKELSNEKIKFYEIPLYILAIIFSTNQEQIAIAILAIYTIYMGYSIYNKKVSKLQVTLLFISTFSLVYILTCPGNYVRRIAEIENWYPDYLTLNIIDKIQLSFTSLIRYLSINTNLIYIFFTGILAYAVFSKNTTVKNKIIAIIPFLSAVVPTLLSDVISKTFSCLPDFIATFSETRVIIDQTSFIMLKNYIYLDIFIIVLISIAYSLTIVFEDIKSKWLALMIYFVGIGTRIIMSFSPTIFASTERTCLVLYYSFVILSLLVFNKIIGDLKTKRQKKIKDNVLIILFIMSVANIVNEVIVMTN